MNFTSGEWALVAQEHHEAVQARAVHAVQGVGCVHAGGNYVTWANSFLAQAHTGLHGKQS